MSKAQQAFLQYQGMWWVLHHAVEKRPGVMYEHHCPAHLKKHIQHLTAEDLCNIRPDLVGINPLYEQENREKQEISELLLKFDREVLCL